MRPAAARNVRREFLFALERNRKVKSGLHLHPGLRSAAESLGKTNCHFRRNRGPFIDNVVESLARDAEHLGYPPGRDPLRTIHITIQLPTAPPKRDISTLLALGHFYFALTLPDGRNGRIQPIRVEIDREDDGRILANPRRRPEGSTPLSCALDGKTPASRMAELHFLLPRQRRDRLQPHWRKSEETPAYALRTCESTHAVR